MTVFSGLPEHHFGAILADPPWHFTTWSPEGRDRSPDYPTMSLPEIQLLPVRTLAKRDCVLFLWVTWPLLQHGLKTIKRWGFTYKTCAFAWMKANASQLEMFNDPVIPEMGNGYWTRANTEVCLLGTRGRPRRVDAGVRQAIIEQRREHSRKPDVVHRRIEQLVSGPYLELFARAPRAGWTVWGDDVDKFAGTMPDAKLD